ncbi:MAG TPA: nucleotidyltransferase domain-containing protein [Terriglobia bacterium]|jgi:predicted nucleotidyltransferase|nr:nucleotidyltransferase domain-containing protein [Terriglobia bacterium]
MDALVQGKTNEVAEICKQRGVRRLALFGSAAAGTFDSASSDLDFLVEFAPQSPAQLADNYFGLQEDLERLFQLPVELAEPGPIRNPYFKRAIERTQVVLYAAT